MDDALERILTNFLSSVGTMKNRQEQKLQDENHPLH